MAFHLIKQLHSNLTKRKIDQTNYYSYLYLAKQ
jgi:hypothetical protein